MKCSINVYLLNDHFSQEYADEHNGGNESELNRKHEWEDELELSSSTINIIEKKDSTYTIRGSKGEEEFNIDIPKMRLFDIETAEGIAQLGCSESILSEASYKKLDSGDWVLTIYLKDFEPMANPIPGLYIASQEFPKELIAE